MISRTYDLSHDKPLDWERAEGRRRLRLGKYADASVDSRK